MVNSAQGVGVVDSLVVDEVHRFIYFTNMGFVKSANVEFSWHKIEAMTLNGTNRHTVYTKSQKPRGLFIDKNAR